MTGSVFDINTDTQTDTQTDTVSEIIFDYETEVEELERFNRHFRPNGSVNQETNNSIRIATDVLPRKSPREIDINEWPRMAALAFVTAILRILLSFLFQPLTVNGYLLNMAVTVSLVTIELRSHITWLKGFFLLKKNKIMPDLVLMSSILSTQVLTVFLLAQMWILDSIFNQPAQPNPIINLTVYLANLLLCVCYMGIIIMFISSGIWRLWKGAPDFNDLEINMESTDRTDLDSHVQCTLMHITALFDMLAKRNDSVITGSDSEPDSAPDSGLGLADLAVTPPCDSWCSQIGFWKDPISIAKKLSSRCQFLNHNLKDSDLSKCDIEFISNTLLSFSTDYLKVNKWLQQVESRNLMDMNGYYNFNAYVYKLNVQINYAVYPLKQFYSELKDELKCESSANEKTLQLYGEREKLLSIIQDLCIELESGLVLPIFEVRN